MTKEQLEEAKKFTEEEVERALLLADEENENSISSGKSFNAQGWAKKVLAFAVRKARTALTAAKRHLEDEQETAISHYTSLVARTTECDSLRAEVSASHARVKDLEEKLHDKHRINESQREEISALTGAIAVQRQTLEARISALEADNTRLASELGEETARLKERDAAVEEMWKGLESMANPQCGCKPECVCLEPHALEVFRQWVRETASELLAKYPRTKEAKP